MAELIHPELCYKLYGIFYEIHNRLGHNLKEAQYEDACAVLFAKYQIAHERQVEIPIVFENIKIQGNRLDFWIKKIIPVDIKAKKYITKEDYKEMQRYLKTTNCQLGLIVNFRSQKTEIKRVINSKGKY